MWMTLRWLISFRRGSRAINGARIWVRADQHQRVGVAQPLGQRVRVLHVVVPYGDRVAVQLAETGQARSVSK